MPELPEVETMARDLAPAIGARIGIADLHTPSIVAGSPDELIMRLRGRTITGVWRRAKTIVIDLDAGLALLMAPRMTGAPRLEDPATPPRDRHDHLGLYLSRGSGPDLRLIYRDPRRFGRIRLVERTADGYRDGAGRDPFAALGPEPIDPSFSARDFAARLYARGGRRTIKTALIDQSVVVGVGNIYADEACFAARIDPRTPVDALSDAQREAVGAAAIAIMREAITRRGSRVQSYRAPAGGEGMAAHLAAYGRAGLPCLRCGTEMEKLRVAGRGTTRCPRCQPVTVSD
jgi:formamidopyrimidine-DNA glycosylase